MKLNSLVPGLHLSIWLYRRLMKLHTAQFQAEWGNQMLLHHEDAYRDAWNKNRYYGVVALWLSECKDLVPDVFEECKDQYQVALWREGSMNEFLSLVAQFSSKVAMIIAGGLAALFWITLSASGVFQSSIEQSVWFIILFDGAIAVVGMLCLAFWKTLAAAIN